MTTHLESICITRRHLTASVVALTAGKAVLTASGNQRSPINIAGVSAGSAAQNAATSAFIGKQASVQPPLAASALPASVEVTMMEMFFEPSEITISANTDVSFVFVNKGYLSHDFLIKELAIYSGVLRTGGSATMVLNLPVGTYTYYCSQIGHKSAGMQGTLTVV